MGLSNDERGWVMTSLSGIACVLGASVICVDIIIRQFPGKRNFRIEDSDVFLSTSLSLSFGVMLFSSLFSMLPSAKQSLRDGGFSPKEASWIMIACFIGGVVGIQIVSNVLHRFIPSHVVECEHTHDETATKHAAEGSQVTAAPTHHHGHEAGHGEGHGFSVDRFEHATSHNKRPLLESIPNHDGSGRDSTDPELSRLPRRPHTTSAVPALQADKHPSLGQRLSTRLPSLSRAKDLACEDDCRGYDPPCNTDCFKTLKTRASFRRENGGSRSASRGRDFVRLAATENTPLLHNSRESRNSSIARPHEEREYQPAHRHEHSDQSSRTIQAETSLDQRKTTTHDSHQPDHHHHVPTNAFLSIGLQTSIAIALHKLPEGFITYATNHANPKLGVAVFLALFIHNITEGFAMALPLYLAIQSRVMAMVISFILGGLSQPLGAGIAALWFKIAGEGDWAPSEGVYGGMFAVTAGIMASVALQLFSEALDLTHSRQLCMVGAFSGMAILGISSALTA